MGLFSSIGKAVKGVVSNVSKAVSLKNVVNVVTGNIGAVGKEVAGRVVKSAVTPFVKPTTTAQNLANAQAAIKNLLPATLVNQLDPATVNRVKDAALNVLPPNVRSSFMPSATKPVAGKKLISTGDPQIDEIVNATVGGALTGAGVAIGGSDVGNAATNSVGWTAAKTWLKKNWYVPVAAVVAIGAGLYFFVFKKKSGKRSPGW